MRFASISRSYFIAASFVVLSTNVSQAGVVTHHHRLKLPQSYSALAKAQDKPSFTVSQPLVAARVKAANGISVAQAVGTVHQGFYPISEAKDEGFNFTGMARQLPDVTRNAANDAAGVMSWTAKFN